jgi:diguanylate cyclase (GGDEF)-like protein/PAS domain S-box-containing protein
MDFFAHRSGRALPPVSGSTASSGEAGRHRMKPGIPSSADSLSAGGGAVGAWLQIAEQCSLESARDSLERAASRIARLTDSDLVGIAYWNAEGRIFDANRTFIEMVGYTSLDIAGGGVDWSTLRSSDGDRPANLCVGHDARREIGLVRKDGSTMWCLASVQLVDEARHECVGFFLDVSERVARYDELRVMHDALEATVDAVVITDRDGTIEWVNPAFTEMTGYAFDEAIGRTPRLLRSGLMKPAFYDHLWRTIQAGDVWRGEIVNRRRDGALYVEEMSITPIRREGVVTHFIAIKQDISERQRTEAAMRESEQRFRDLFEQSLDAIMVTDPEMRIIDANPACERLTGWSRDELLSQNALSLIEDPDARERFQQTLRDRSVVRDLEVTGRTRDGSLVEMQINAVPRWDDRGRLLGYQAITRDITARKRFEEELQHLAFHDWLTGLPNLALFRDRLEHAVAQADRTSTRVALIYLDLDRFKTVNDGHGHNAGDRAIQQVSRRLLACFREEDTVARIGGDEFTVVIERLSGPAQLTHILERVASSLRTPLMVDGHRVEVEASIGAAIFQGGVDGVRPNSRLAEELIRKADAAMYQAKRRTGTRYHIFDPAVDLDGSARIRQQQELRRAIESDQLMTEYQPVVSIASGDLWGVEVLARWRHPERGIVPPGDFIPLAEESGLIGQLGEWILERACRDLAAWIRSGKADGLRLLVNLSARQLEDRDLPARLEALIRRYEISPSRLHLEVTESVAIQHPGRVQALRAMGASVSVDDFGTGYSSLRYLKDLDVDSLKIEMGFVQGMESDNKLAAIVRTIIALGRELGLDVVAEGIESQTQLAMLREMGCRLGQGFLFSRPVDSSGLMRELERRQITDAMAPEPRPPLSVHRAAS